MQSTSLTADFLTVRVDFILDMLPLPGVLFLTPSFLPPLVAALHVVRRQHAGLAGPLHSAVHPALVDGLSVDDDIAIPERDLVVVLSRVVVQRPVDALQTV